MSGLLCDADGVPSLIQRLRYWPGGMMFEATFFNGESRFFPTDSVCRSIGLMQFNPDKMQLAEAENNITKLALMYWH